MLVFRVFCSNWKLNLTTVSNILGRFGAHLMSDERTNPPLEYSRRLYENVVDWYKIAETKAQIILSLDGIFTSLLVGALFVKGPDLKDTLKFFGPETWIFLALMAACLVTAIICALVCLVSRVMPRKEIQRRYGATLKNCPPDDYPPEVMWFFQTISQLNEEFYTRQAGKVSSDLERRALSNQNFLLSGKVLK
jgi:hypothetical protein